jgi:hypothetical protein
MEFIPPKSESAKTTCAEAGVKESVSAPESPAKVDLDKSKFVFEEKVRFAMGKFRTPEMSNSLIGLSQVNLYSFFKNLKSE